MSRSQLTAVVLLLFTACLASACTPKPMVQEEFPEPRPWFAVEAVEFDDSGVVTVRGQMLSDVAEEGLEDQGSHDESMTGQGDPGAFPEHIAYGFWPDPDEVGTGEAVDVGPDGSLTFEYDLSRPDGIRRGWHVLQFDKAGWGSQMIWIDVADREWSEIRPR